MKVYQLIEFLKLNDPQADSESVLSVLFPSRNQEVSSPVEESSKVGEFPSAKEVALFLDVYAMPSNCATNSAGWVAIGENYLEFDDCEGGYDYRCEIDIYSDRAVVSLDYEKIVHTLDELAEFICDSWGC